MDVLHSSSITVSSAGIEYELLKKLREIDNPGRRIQLMIKRLIDVTGAAVGLVLLSLFLLLLVIVIKMESRGPAIIVQRRLGQFGHVFRLYKFRSMYIDAEMLKNSDGSTKVLDNDPRVTKFGRIIRRYGLDELPQLINVLRGEMSLVGPRPDLDIHLKYYENYEYLKLGMRPGITSYAQVLGRNGLPWKKRIEIEIEYVKEFSLLLDLWILWRTIIVIWRGIGVNNPS